MDIIEQRNRAAKELRKHQRALKEVQAEMAPKKPFKFGAWLDRTLLEIAVHIPVAVAIGISCYGWEQYGAFAYGLAPLTFAISFLLSRAYSMCIKTHRYDVAGWLVVLGAMAFIWEAYGVHLGLERFNHTNEVAGLQTFAGWVLILASIMLGLMNVASRRAFVTGHDDAAEDAARPEAWWKWAARRERQNSVIARAELKGDRLNGAAIPSDFARMCYERNGGWPLGYKPTAEDLAAVAA